jgi:hypothetical protein
MPNVSVSDGNRRSSSSVSCADVVDSELRRSPNTHGRIDPINRSTNPFCQGLRGAERISCVPNDSTLKLLALGSVPIAYQVSCRISIGEGFYHLLPYPSAGGMFRNPKMQHFPAIMREHEKHKQYPQSDCRHSKEVRRDNFANMVF